MIRQLLAINEKPVDICKTLGACEWEENLEKHLARAQLKNRGRMLFANKFFQQKLEKSQ